MKGTACKNCLHFKQHYILSEDRFLRAHCGHCTFSRVKRKKPDSVGCEKFEFAQKDEERFVSKQYLSKKLLHRLMHVELLPQITDEETDG